jgi:hypothetical protein
MRGVGRDRTERALDHSGNLIITDRSRSAWTSLIQEPFEAILQKAPTPLADGVLMQTKLVCYGLARYTLCTP